ncbi:hypothetical protein APY03_0250 [Variovorax sp. WDL1]|nr:hypothetical protein APY03_0250 [Variovorax sp. WDL1]
MVKRPTDPGVWKAKLAQQLAHDGSPFAQLISDYLTEDKKPDLSFLVCECMRHGNVDVLAYVLANEDIKSLRIQGPVDEEGWETLAKAMPDSLRVEVLQLSKLDFNASTGELLFKFLSHMPALKDVSLTNIKVEDGFFFGRLVCADLPSLEDLSVCAKSDQKLGVGPLVLKILLAARQVRRVSIEDAGAISTAQHAKLAEALSQQTRLDSLRLKISYRNEPEEFECYMPFLCGKTPTPLVELDLRGCRIQASNFKLLMEALPKNQPALKSLLLSECRVAFGEKRKEQVSVNTLSLTRMESLQYLDLSINDLPAGTTEALLMALKKNHLVFLNLSGNQVGNETFSAMACFLRDNEKLRHLLLKPPAFTSYVGQDAQVLEELIEAVERNLVVQQLDIRWTQVPKDSHDRLSKSLERNRQLAIAAAVRGGVYAIGNSHHVKVPYDVADAVFRQGLTMSDAFSASSVNKEAWALREKILREESDRILRERL